MRSPCVGYWRQRPVIVRTTDPSRGDFMFTLDSADVAIGRYFGEGCSTFYHDADALEAMSLDDAEYDLGHGRVDFYDEDGSLFTIQLGHHVTYEEEGEEDGHGQSTGG